ncbi:MULTISPECIES: LysR substrate-binding domain-containing protein [Pseudomonas]|uniref:LysR substrate-binding domain-containing protein n=1 Tax=Pseudomonas TaxID=286 RepID=UPI000FD582C9|nr:MULTISPECIES: LysR substrate-binding domain-containing protein [Pseudomonas]MCG7050362.1 LysR family transcriptional regulator [Pseudomonas aeruginosa]RUI12991.1 LysR family transcriptional regulator [Pseudomonas aeruginosa]GLU38077.1 LysR family transcriptional regulator [Pseudomonas sp. NBRC 100443]HBO1523000.1 LysR family transcriptional regulator [Pseudomonas aeruginosa]HBO6119262.1 LysR family transcriptional regulator [Pseudomonas aeruginosa]
MTSMRRPPPLQLLPAFEASARLLSFSKAAQELHLTTSAISQQIKQLENQLGLPLFRRLTRRLELTDAGHQFARVASQTLAIYRQGHAEFAHRFDRPTLRLSMTPLIAHEFLLPHVEVFQARHPGVSLSLEASMELVDFEKEPVDAAIRVGHGQWPGLESWLLCGCEAVLLAVPSLLARHPVNRLEDLEDHTLIRRRHEQFGWESLASLAKVPTVPSKGDLLVDSDLAALHAAERGLGIALGFLPAGTPFSKHWPDTRLVAVLPPLTTPLSAYFVFRPDNGKAELLREAFDWIRSQVTPVSSHDG